MPFSSYRAVSICRSGARDPLSLPAARIPAQVSKQVLLALHQIRVPQGACERTKHLTSGPCMTCTPARRASHAVRCTHTAVACPQCPVGVGARTAYPISISRASIRSCLPELPADHWLKQESHHDLSTAKRCMWHVYKILPPPWGLLGATWRLAPSH